MPELPPTSISEHLATLTDPRRDQLQEHHLLDTVTIALCAVICGADDWVAVETFGRAKQAWLRFARLTSNPIALTLVAPLPPFLLLDDGRHQLLPEAPQRRAAHTRGLRAREQVRARQGRLVRVPGGQGRVDSAQPGEGGAAASACDQPRRNGLTGRQ